MLEQRIIDLKERLFTQVARVEAMVDKSVRSMVDRDEELAREVVQEDEPNVNLLEIEIEDMAINLMALYQPEASNLRTIIMILKMNNDLERIGDHAVNIAEHALHLISHPPVKPFIDLPRMATIAIGMLKDSLDSFVRWDPELAVEVCERDEEVDSLRDQITRELITYVMGNPTIMDRALRLILVARDLERIADLATNISEDVVFMVEGEIIKHHRGRGKPERS